MKFFHHLNFSDKGHASADHLCIDDLYKVNVNFEDIDLLIMKWKVKGPNKDYEIHIYEGAGHAFANPSGNNFNAGYAEDAWNRTLNFLRERLAASSD